MFFAGMEYISLPSRQEFSGRVSPSALSIEDMEVSDGEVGIYACLVVMMEMATLTTVS